VEPRTVVLALDARLEHRKPRLLEERSERRPDVAVARLREGGEEIVGRRGPVPVTGQVALWIGCRI
jgi:hypothetical protein